MIEQFTIDKVLKSAVAVLQENRIKTSAHDARVLLEALTGYTHAQIISHGDDLVSQQIAQQYHDQILQRIEGKPVQRILGKCEFYGREFHLNADTLIPRPDTEILIEEVLALLSGKTNPVRLLEIGTGSGAIAVTLACALDNIEVLATDISKSALGQAEQNAILHGAHDRISFKKTDLFDQIKGSFDVIVSNPPYIPTADIASLQVEVRNHDPVCALDGGESGLDFYRDIFGHAHKFLRPNGFMCVEIGIGQSDAICDIIQYNNLDVVSKKKDLSDIYRVITAKA